jgi:hypothetical protein
MTQPGPEGVSHEENNWRAAEAESREGIISSSHQEGSAEALPQNRQMGTGDEDLPHRPLRDSPGDWWGGSLDEDLFDSQLIGSKPWLGFYQERR